MSAPELLPCPFCGAHSKHIGGVKINEPWIFCYKCGATSPYKETREEVIEAWNIRTDHEAALAKAETRIKKLEAVVRNAATQMEEAYDELSSWSAYASDYFKERWNLDEALQTISGYRDELANIALTCKENEDES